MTRSLLHVSVAFGIFVLLGAGFSEYQKREAQPSMSQAVSSHPAALRAYWSAEIDRVGAEQTYAEFKSLYRDGSNNVHTAAHIMGDLLYEKLGLRGFPICDDSFGYGCYHAYLSRVLGDYGSAVVPELGRACFDTLGASAGPCFHGIGHGLMQHFGEAHLAKALRKCTELRTAVVPKGIEHCVAGVFMDYNAPFSTDTDDLQVIARPMDPHDPFVPCSEGVVPAEFEQTCYYSLPHWWFQQPGMNAETIGRLCLRAPHAYWPSCYAGIGVDLPGSLDYDQERIITACGTMPDQEKSDWCLKGSANTLSEFHLDSCLIRKKLGFREESCI